MKILFVEPFYGGSHKQLIDTLIKLLPCESDLVSLPAKKWPWRARCSALTLSQLIPNEKYTTLFCSSVLCLTELLGLRPDLISLKKIVYFHENQLVYPVQQIKERDFQFGYNQILTCLSADVVLFNSKYNLNSFLTNINKFIKIMPDCRPKDMKAIIEPKCRVLHFPIIFKSIPNLPDKTDDVLNIVWPHRWEFDKGPEIFFRTIFKIKELNLNFKLSILGEVYTDVPDIFHEAKVVLDKEIIHFGFLESKEKYYQTLCNSDVVVSTAKHEFYGVAMLEAVYCGCYPIVPNDLVYPEIYDKECLYKNEEDLFSKLMFFCENPKEAKNKRSCLKVDFCKYSSENLIPQFVKVLEISD